MSGIICGTLLAAILLVCVVVGEEEDFDGKRLLTRHCPQPKLQSVIPNIDCPGTLLQCARRARTVAQRQFAHERNHQGYAWGALVIRANSSISDHIASSMKAVKPNGWFCTALSESRIYVVHVFRTGYRFRNSSQDQWTYLANRPRPTQVCPLLQMKVYIDQYESPTNSSRFVSDLLHYVKGEYPLGQFEHEQWNVIVVTPHGRSLLEKDFDFSFPVYLYNGSGAWCMMSTRNGWLVIVAKIGYSDATEEGFARS
uniref:Uncharacterized protein n=1 Tax=Plectus sambesii TaxID=2011161 RepID=A0A914UUH0_9BILA